MEHYEFRLAKQSYFETCCELKEMRLLVDHLFEKNQLDATYDHSFSLCLSPQTSFHLNGVFYRLFSICSWEELLHSLFSFLKAIVEVDHTIYWDAKVIIRSAAIPHLDLLSFLPRLTRRPSRHHSYSQLTRLTKTVINHALTLRQTSSAKACLLGQEACP